MRRIDHLATAACDDRGPVTKIWRSIEVNIRGWINIGYGPPGERRTCPACGSGDLKPLDPMWHFRRDASRYVGFATGCRRCGLVFANPFPTLAALAEYYAAESEYMDRRRQRVGSTRRRLGGAPPTPADSDHRKISGLKAQFASIEEHLDLRHPPANARVLDFGCGPGYMLNRLQAHGWETYGIEPADKSAFVRHRELEVPPAVPTFHLIIVHHVLEHLGNPLAVLSALSRSLLDGGILYISVPRLDAVALHGDLRYCINSHTHIVSYTGACLRTLLTMAGLSPLTVRNEEELDRVLTDGEPRRLRLLARKDGNIPAPPAEPLLAAEAAFRDYYRTHPREARYRLHGLLPVRLRASWMQRVKISALAAHSRAKARN